MGMRTKTLYIYVTITYYIYKKKLWLAKINKLIVRINVLFTISQFKLNIYIQLTENSKNNQWINTVDT